MKPKKQGRKEKQERGRFFIYLFICEEQGVMGGSWFGNFP